LPEKESKLSGLTFVPSKLDRKAKFILHETHSLLLFPKPGNLKLESQSNAVTVASGIIQEFSLLE
jgi:hypothetical protein